MNKYWVVKKEIHKQGYVIDAENEDEALEKVREGDGDLDDGYFEYHSTLDPWHWEVEPYSPYPYEEDNETV